MDSFSTPTKKASKDDVTKPRLGRGLAALLGEVGEEVSIVERTRGQKKVPVEFLRPNPRNPRKNFTQPELDELANSIRARGLIQPIVVRVIPGLADVYEIVAGERRWRAAQRAGLHDVPVSLIDADDRMALELAVIENIQRSDLNAIEEAFGYQQLMSEFSYSHQELGDMIGKSRSHVANMLRLLKLPEPIRAMVIDGRISSGHARALLAFEQPEKIASRIVQDGLNVRDVEALAQAAAPKSASPRPVLAKDADTNALEKALKDVLGLHVVLAHKGEGGEVRIRYTSLDQLDQLCRRLKT